MPQFRLKTLSACKGTKNKRKIQNKFVFLQTSLYLCSRD
jgi:hypothetical protein